MGRIRVSRSQSRQRHRHQIGGRFRISNRKHVLSNHLPDEHAMETWSENGSCGLQRIYLRISTAKPFLTGNVFRYQLKSLLGSHSQDRLRNQSSHRGGANGSQNSSQFDSDKKHHARDEWNEPATRLHKEDVVGTCANKVFVAADHKSNQEQCRRNPCPYFVERSL